jgi:tRNA pseudouridine-54 N-methylase
MIFFDEHSADVSTVRIRNDDFLFVPDHTGVPAASDGALKSSVAKFADESVP